MKMKQIISLLLVLVMVFGMIPAVTAAEPAALYDLRVNDLVAPVGLDRTPSFSWKMKSDAIGAKQTAYAITVSHGENTLWNTGWVESDCSVGISYAGPALESSTEYAVEIKVKDQDGKELSASTTFETGLLGDNPWVGADWISYGTAGSGSNITTYTIDFDFIVDRHSNGFCFGMQDTGTFVMWQFNTYEGIKSGGTNQILLRPHFKKNGSWTDYPGKSSSSIKAMVLNDTVGYNAKEVVGKKVHERIVVDGKNITTYFGTDENNLVSAGTYTLSSTTPLGRIGFRHSNGSSEGLEQARYDNIVIRDGNGEVIYENDFSGTDHRFSGSYMTVVDGMLQVGASSMPSELVCIQSEGSHLPAYRKSFTPKEQLVSAKLYTAGLGVYETYLNGERVGRLMDDGSVKYDELKPGFTEGDARQFYHSYDVTWMLAEGENVLSSIVTSGWWTGDVASRTRGKETAYRAKLILTYANGEQEVINTDTTWKNARVSPLLLADIFDGETYDARMDLSWKLPGYDDSAWGNAKVNTEYKYAISAHYGSPISVKEELEQKPVSVYLYDEIQNATSSQYGKVHVIGTYGDESFTLHAGETAIVDFGQNFAGWEYFELEAAAGTNINVKHAEILNDNNGLKSRGNDGAEGTVYQANLRSAIAQTNYIASGKGVETYHPAFTFYGFRYISITATDTVTFHKIRGQVVTSAEQDTGWMETSDADVNQLISNIRWGMYSNYLSTATDCPQRDERQGWTADTQVFSMAGMYLNYSKSFLMKWMQDMRDGQSQSNGAYPSTAPSGDNNGGHNQGPLGWVDAGVIVPYNLYVMYGDTSVITENWDSMVLFMDKFMASTNGMGGAHNYGDWLAYESNDTEIKNMLGVSYYAWDALLMSEMAAAIGNTDAQAKYLQVYEDEKALYQSKYVLSDGSLKRGEQSVCLYALYLDLLPNEESVAKVTLQLISNIERNGNKLQTGFLGTAILNNTLTKLGRTDVAYKLLLQHDNPSWLYPVDNGATTMWERWNSYTVEKGFGDASMNSFNHYAYGAVAGWMFRDMAGIGYDTQNPGFKHIILSPRPDQSLPEVRASYDSAYGTIVSNMVYEGSTWNYACTVPANTTATIHLPVSDPDSLTVGGDTSGLTYVDYANGIATFEAVAGSYTFATSVEVEYFVKVEATGDSADAMGGAMLYVNGELAASALPATLAVREGDVITAEASPLNPVDYRVAGWFCGEEVLSEDGSLTYTVKGNADLTVKLEFDGLYNLAKGKPVTATQVNTDWKASNLTDGHLTYHGSNGWSSANAGKSATFSKAVTAVIDLGEEMAFDRFHLYPRNLNPGNVNFPVAYTIYVSSNNADWTPVYTTSQGSTTNGYEPAVIQLGTSVYGRYVKLEVTAVNSTDESGNAYVQLSEMGVYNVAQADVPVEKYAAEAALLGLSAYQTSLGIKAEATVLAAIEAAKTAVQAFVDEGGSVEELTNYGYIAVAEAALEQWKSMQIDTYTIDFDFTVVEEGTQGFAFGMKDTNTFIMWQVNGYKNKNTDKTILLRPHFMTNGKWTDYPGLSGSNVKAVDITAAVGHNTDTLPGSKVHERIEVSGNVIKTWFGPDAENLTLADTYTHSSNVVLHNIGFRHSCSTTDGYEIAVFDNFVVRNGEGEVIYTEDFSDPEAVVFAGNANARFATVENGSVTIGGWEYVNDQVYLMSKAVVVNQDPSAEEAAAVDALIAAVDPTDGASVAAAREAYEALSDEAKALVTKLAELEAAEAYFAVASSCVKLSVTAPETAGVQDAAVAYTVSASGMVKTSTMVVKLAVPAELLSDFDVAFADDWSPVSVLYDAGVLTIVMINIPGANGEGELFTVTGKPTGQAGTAAVTVIEASAAGYVSESNEIPVGTDVTEASASVTLDPGRSPFDVNFDGVVDLLDLTRAQRFFGSDDAEHADFDLDNSGEVDVADLILILINFTEKF